MIVPQTVQSVQVVFLMAVANATRVLDGREVRLRSFAGRSKSAYEVISSPPGDVRVDLADDANGEVGDAEAPPEEPASVGSSPVEEASGAEAPASPLQAPAGDDSPSCEAEATPARVPPDASPRVPEPPPVDTTTVGALESDSAGDDAGDDAFDEPEPDSRLVTRRRG